MTTKPTAAELLAEMRACVIGNDGFGYEFGELVVMLRAALDLLAEAEAEADSERLDWLERERVDVTAHNDDQSGFVPDYNWELFHDGWFHASTLRAAIDVARAKEKP